MARLAKQKPIEIEIEVSDDELPELSSLLKGSVTENSDGASRKKLTLASPVRTSPRRRGTRAASPKPASEAPTASRPGLDLSKGISAISLTASTIALPKAVSPMKRSPVKDGKTKAQPDMQKPPVKRCGVPAPEMERESGAAMSMQQRQRPLKLAHVNSLLLPLSQVALGGGVEGTDDDSDVEFVSSSRGNRNMNVDVKAKPAGRVGGMLSPIEELASIRNVYSRDAQNERERDARRPSPNRAAKEKANYLSRFVLKEARCNDDEGDSEIDNDDDEGFTDLSGFIVDDEAELSVHESDSDVNSGIDSRAEKAKRKERSGKRRLRRGRDGTRTMMGSEDQDNAAGMENMSIGDIAQDLFKMKLSAPTNEEQRTKEIEVVDLTYSPPKAQPDLKAKQTTTAGKKGRPSTTKKSSSDIDPFLCGENDRFLKFSPARFKSAAKISSDPLNTSTINKPASQPADSKADTFKTPPVTPPASPTKLKSPSKVHLLSPSKRRAHIPTSPHRQSIDAFWSSDVINTWNDQYSPRKPPLTVSPKKRGLSRLLDFNIWSDSDTEDVDVSRDGSRDGNASSSSDPPTPTRSSSPRKASVLLSKFSSPSKKALAEARRTFESTRDTTAHSLLAHLDTNITSNKLFTLSASTGGVQILWSKTLRSTAGRANWRRTVTKISSPAKACPETQPRIQHYASIDLAEKVIDSDSRLVNTLAHEFCHLANFMVSGVRDQPHGASFKAWADKVTTHLRTAPNLPELYRSVEVTTKHSYFINHKYLWVCAGLSALPGSAQAAARAFLALDDDPGCGVEYGRHSKSIDPEKHRCGKCKGLLVQVRPKPRIRRAEPETGKEMRSESSGKMKRASPAKWRIGIDAGSGESEEAGVGGSNDKLDDLEKALK